MVKNKGKKLLVIDGEDLIQLAFWQTVTSANTYDIDNENLPFEKRFTCNLLNILNKTIQHTKPDAIVSVFLTPIDNENSNYKQCLSYRQTLYSKHQPIINKLINISNIYAKEININVKSLFDIYSSAMNYFGISIVKPCFVLLEINSQLVQAYVESDYAIATITNFQPFKNWNVIIASTNLFLNQLITDNVVIYDYLLNKDRSAIKFTNIQAINELFGIAPEKMIDLYALFTFQNFSIHYIPDVGNFAPILIQRYHDLDTILKDDVKKSGFPKKTINSLKENKDLILLNKQLIDLKNIYCPQLEQNILEAPIKLLTYEKFSEELENLCAEKIDKEFNLMLIDIIYHGEPMFGETSFAKTVKKEKNTGKEKNSGINKKSINNLLDEKLDEENEEDEEDEEENAAENKQFITEANQLTKFFSNVSFETPITLFVRKNLNIHQYEVEVSIEKKDIIVINLVKFPHLQKPLVKKIIQILNDKRFTIITYSMKEVFKVCEHYSCPKAQIKDIEIFYCLVSHLINHNPLDDHPIINQIKNNKRNSITLIQKIYPFLERSIADNNLKSLYLNIELPLIPIIAKIEKYGVPINEEYLKKTLENQNQNTASEKSTFKIIQKLISAVDPKTHRIYPTLDQTKTATGRIISSKPNLQGVPKNIRNNLFQTKQKVIIHADYSQAEIRILAMLAEEEKLINAFVANKDIHVETAAKILNITEAEAKKEQYRKIGKNINYAIIYGMTSYGLHKKLKKENIEIDIKKIELFIKAYFKEYYEIQKYQEEIVENLKDQNAMPLINLFGRKFRNYTPLAKNYKNAVGENNAAKNFPIQSLQSDIFKLAIVQLDEQFQKQKLTSSKILLPIHDEIIIETEEQHKEETIEIIKQVMEYPEVMYPVPLKVNITSYSSNYTTV